jgi:plastocyanin
MPILLVLALAAHGLPATAWAGPMEQPPRVRSGRPAPTPWLAADGRMAAIGLGTRLTIHDRSDAAGPVEIVLDAPAVSGALLGPSLLILGADGALLHLDVRDPAAGAQRLAGLPLARPVALAALGKTLVVADEARGLELLAIPPLPHRGHHGAAPAQRRTIAPERAGFVPWTEPIVAMAAGDHRVAIAHADGTLAIMGDDPAAGTRRIPLGEPARALALASGRIYALVPSGLVRIDLRGGEDPPRPVHVAEAAGVALAFAGREVSILSADAALARIIDDAPAALMHNVEVLNNLFSPDMLTIFPGDSVRWSNAMGFHNVVSCTTDQSGCTADAAESFTSGPVGPLWVHTHTFQQPGANPYVCQPHAPDMTGTVIVAPPPAPPPVPDGRDGAPMLVEPLDPNAASLSIAWDDASCGTASSYHMIWGQRSHLPATPGGAFSFAGAVCGIATPFVWSGSPDPAAIPGRIIWWLILPVEGTTEGSWGVDAQGAERTGPGAGGSSGGCGVLSKEVSAACSLTRN